ncbi:cell division inhibitor SulA/protein ImuA [Natronospira proteinivora]|uniref:Cell division inhibitor SulA/protein ImuA n=1 Tax=Natronospira proteinivora TaxID=1807133 RepID=A0ABT1G500_9GAMM|nr:cell division inhibitor SulA/protein ImuA [Natronospira proteinivora]
MFRPRRADQSAGPVLSTGFAALDQVLPSGGWPRGVLVELLAEQWGMGELRLIMPALASLSARGRWLVWVSPPYLPYAPALSAQAINPGHCLLTRPDHREERVWVAEQSLKSGACGAVLAWDCPMSDRHVRRLQLASEASDALAFIFRPVSAARQRSPAALRLQLAPEPAGLRLTLLKVRGGQAGRVSLPLD